MKARDFVRHFVYRSGAFSVIRPQRSLTVAMFHRVMSACDPDFAMADPTYTVTDDLFTEILDFFRAHYEIVSLADVMAAADDLRHLPDHALLITFDDGWADNLRYGVPALARYHLPATIFIAADAVMAPGKVWWQERVFSAVKHVQDWGSIYRLLPDVETLSRSPARAPDPLEFVCRLAAMDDPGRDAILDLMPTPEPASRMMLTRDDLPSLVAAGISIGIHGCSHLPLTEIADVDGELRRAQMLIASLIGRAGSTTALALPHGRYDRRVIEAARRTGMRLIFSSDPALLRTRAGAIDVARPIGRIGIEASQVTNAAGRLDAARAATWLWRRSML